MGGKLARIAFDRLPRVEAEVVGAETSDSSAERAHAAARPSLRAVEWSAMLAASAAVLVASYTGAWSVSVAEAWGFATGGVCVWLVVREHVWNWPIGMANNVFFFVLFLESRLFADMALQVVYFGLAVFGWWNWLRGGAQHGRLGITRASRRELAGLVVVLVVGTLALRRILIELEDAAPFWDASTTVLSLVAQYLLSRKRLENWWFWLAADLIYVPLYVGRGLPLTALLYGVFLVLCVVGVRAWSRTLRVESGAA